MSAESSPVSWQAFQRELREEIDRRYNLADLRVLASDLDIEFENLKGNTKTEKVVSLIEWCKRKGRLPLLLKLLKEQRPYGRWPRLPEDEDTGEEMFPFINRADEINIIMSSYPPYRMVEAPTGYGKTQLLRKVKKLFEEQGWGCAYVVVNGRQVDLDPIFSDLFREVDGNPPKKGIVLLIDLERQATRSVVERLVKQVERIQRGLRETVFYNLHPGGFRVILAGRSLSNLLQQTKSQLPLSSLKLSTFDYDVIRRSARSAVPHRNDEAIRQFAAHLLYLTGGHPGCMARVIRVFAATHDTVARFFESTREQILEEIVVPVIDDILSGIFATIRDPAVQQFMESNVFRYTYDPVLKRIIEVHELPGVMDEYDLADKLTTSQLFERDKGTTFLHDGVLRRLAAVHLWYREPDNFVSYCQRAEAICGEYLADPGCQVPARWAIEYLFEGLQQHAGSIGDPGYRERLAESFYEEKVPRAMDLLTRGRGRRARRNDLLFLLHGDWEFQFTVNYYLRGEKGRYSERPFRKLRERVSQW